MADKGVVEGSATWMEVKLTGYKKIVEPVERQEFKPKNRSSTRYRP